MEPSSRPSKTAQSPAITIAVVEDDVSIREVLVSWLRKADGFACVGEFPDAESAIAGLPSLKPHITLVDINLPGRDGVECVKTLKPLLPETQFVMLTVYENSNYIFGALLSGATGYLLKHTPREELLTALREVHAGGSQMSSLIARKVVQALQPLKPKAKAIDQLSKRETEVLSLLAKGYMYKEISDMLGINLTTVNSYIRRIYEKLHVQSRGQAVAVYADLVGKKE